MLKVQFRYYIFDLINTLWVQHPHFQSQTKGCRTIIPAPSSFWGRLNGRFNIPYVIAKSIKHRNDNISIDDLNAHLFYGMRKLARTSRTRRKNIFEATKELGTSSILLNSKEPLVIDDIFTTGSTLNFVGDRLSKEEVYGFAFASAFKY